LYDRTSKLEETLEKFMQTSLTNQKNQEAFMRNLETQVGQLAKQLAEQQSGQFSANTQPNPKEQCKAITIRSGKQVSSDVNVKDIEDKNQTTGDEGKVGKEVPPEAPSMENSKEDGKQDKENSDKNQNWRKIQKEIPLKHVSYPHTLSK